MEQKYIKKSIEAIDNCEMQFKQTIRMLMRLKKIDAGDDRRVPKHTL